MSLIDRNQRFGGTAAEQDELINDYDGFYDTRDFDTIRDEHDRRTFIIGRTGSGKSACFLQLRKSYSDRVATIDPRSFSFQHIINTRVMEKLREYNVRLDPFFYSLWTHVIIVEIIRFKFPQKEAISISQIFEQLKEFLKRRNCREALQYVESCGGLFWETHEVQAAKVVDHLTNKVNSELSAELGLQGAGIRGSIKNESENQLAVTQDITSRFQLIVNEAIVKRMNAVVTTINDHVLTDPKDFMYITIDDLDKDWVDTSLANLMIRCLFDVVLDLTQRIHNLKIVVALRTNLFQQLDLAGASTQEEKYDGQTLNLKWGETDIRRFLRKRLQTASKRYSINPPWELDKLLPHKTPQNDPLQYIIDRTLLRPRDAIAFFNEIFVQASGKDMVRQDDIYTAERTYSRKRLDALRDEWKSPYPDLDKVLHVFRQRSSEMNLEDITDVFNNISLLLLDDAFQGKSWLDPLCRSKKSKRTAADEDYNNMEEWYGYYGGLFMLLFDIGFLGFNRSKIKPNMHPTKSPLYSHMEESGAQMADESLETIGSFYIHPAFHQALAIRPRG
ncbi:MAG: hypothetical protein H0U76_20335 [Ktedonobacteraceae bacterium]|nr:hypothetical protein [Ktedonobacteraceae bacterium]MBA3824250.1 hypothetical protein [Ktedonobacterales bacterium]